ncbi:unnamed protein product [Mytilus coruscus]|uniref:Uncharacterized protein n=1 Tax=Mytilus coruscus TaxID=42192 RepID=A0A6J8CW62_MYTCO|nr:unnamed protein product [Mytilus coruscus]
MAQVLAVPGHIRHGFSYISKFNHDFGRVTGIATTIKVNIVLCDYDKNNLILVDPFGNYLKNLNLDSEPYDVAITSQNIGYVTKPNSRSVLQIDPDNMMVLFQATYNELGTARFCVSAVPNTGSNITDVEENGYEIGSCVLKFHTVNKDSWLSCIGGQKYIMYNEGSEYRIKIDSIATMDSPTDICSDDYGHIYVSGQGSNNIHRLESYVKGSLDGPETTDYKVLDYHWIHIMGSRNLSPSASTKTIVNCILSTNGGNPFWFLMFCFDITNTFGFECSTKYQFP